MTTLPEATLAAISELLRERLGLHFPQPRWKDLERALAGVAREDGVRDPARYAAELLAQDWPRGQVERLARHLTVGETYFFREKESFDSLEHHILPGLIRARQADGRYLRIWCAGCCTGEEAYSLGILLARMIPDPRDWNISILATDINPVFLREASNGIYRDWSLRATPAAIRDGFFVRTDDGRYAVAARIKSMVSFEYLNLADDVYPSITSGTNGMDIILCRNVLIYFQPDRSRRVIRNLVHALAEQGVLFVSAAELSLVTLPELEIVNAAGAIHFRKNTADRHRAAKPASRAPGGKGHARIKSSSPKRESFKSPRPVPPPAGRTAPKALPIELADATSAAHREAVALYEQGRYAEAAERLQALMEKGAPSPGFLALLARACANQGRLPDALEWCGKAIDIDKSNPAWQYLRATILQELGRLEDTAAALRRALYLDHNHILAHFALGNLARHQGRKADSDRHFRNALSVLNAYQRDQVLPESEGITAGRLAEIIQVTIASGGHGESQG